MLILHLSVISNVNFLKMNRGFLDVITGFLIYGFKPTQNAK